MKFSEYIKDFSEDKVKNDFENIVFQFIENEREGKPLNWNHSRPFVSKDKTGKPTGNGFIKYIPLQIFKEKLAGDLSKPMAEQKDVIQYYRKTYIEKALKIDNVNDIYKKLTTGQPDTTYKATLKSRYNHAHAILAVRELIRFDNYLNEMEGKTQPQQNEISDIENVFDHVDISKVYNYFNKELVKTNYLTEMQLKQYLKAAFEQEKPPKDRFTFKNDPQISIIRNIFYRYYTEIAARGRKKGYRKECASLLGNYFIGYNTKKVFDNFNK